MVPVAEQPELQHVWAQLDAEKARAEKRSAFGGGFLAGTGLGLAIFAATFFLVITPKTRAMTNDLAAAKAALEQQRESFMAASEQISQINKDGARRIADLQRIANDSGWYTLLYDPAPVGGASPAISLLNAVRPGLGTLLAKLQPPNQTLTLHWVLPGNVNPIMTPPGSHAVLTRNPLPPATVQP